MEVLTMNNHPKNGHYHGKGNGSALKSDSAESLRHCIEDIVGRYIPSTNRMPVELAAESVVVEYKSLADKDEERTAEIDLPLAIAREWGIIPVPKETRKRQPTRPYGARESIEYAL